MQGITKAYPGVLAVDDVSVDLMSGEVHAILGENGAGKSTLMGILCGLHRPDSGVISIHGSVVNLGSPRDALALGIGYVQQHYSLIPTLTVAQNVVLALHAIGKKPNAGQVAIQLRALSKRYRLGVELDVPVENLGVGKQQRAEILKALIAKPTILALDEPTALLTPQESRDLVGFLHDLAADGVGIFLISHKLEEVIEAANRITVLRRARKVTTVGAAETTASQLAELMIGELSRTAVAQIRASDTAGQTQLEVRNLRVKGDRGEQAVSDVSFAVRAGEIVGIAGLEGNGQLELTEALAGVRAIESGTIHLDGRSVEKLDAHSRRRAGVAHIPADRLRTGFVAAISVADNLVLPRIEEPPYSRWGFVRGREVRRAAARLISYFDIRVPRLEALAGTLSGGNQQKMVLARELERDPHLIVCCYATRGLDFAATEAVKREIVKRRDGGAAIVYASVDLDELLSVTDRIVALHRGKVTGEVRTSGATAEQLGLLMGGADAA
jgi:simple sugar transport system ATP-binding protein